MKYKRRINLRVYNLQHKNVPFSLFLSLPSASINYYFLLFIITSNFYTSFLSPSPSNPRFLHLLLHSLVSSFVSFSLSSLLSFATHKARSGQSDLEVLPHFWQTVAHGRHLQHSCALAGVEVHLSLVGLKIEATVGFPLHSHCSKVPTVSTHRQFRIAPLLSSGERWRGEREDTECVVREGDSDQHRGARAKLCAGCWVEKLDGEGFIVVRLRIIEEGDVDKLELFARSECNTIAVRLNGGEGE